MIDEICVDKFKKFMCSPKLQEVYKKFIETKPKDLGFNFFELVSDIYYRENLHSDILKEFLDSEGKHGEGNKFFRLFVELLNQVNPKLDIKIEDFSNYSTKREEGRIDISILSEASKKAIIIENKINGAPDMEHQLPSYVNGLENKGYSVVAVVYLTLGVSNGPNRDEKWSEEDCKKVDEKLVKLVAHQLPVKTCLSSWLKECIDLAEKNDVKIILKHYKDLICHLGKESVNMEEVGNFYSLLHENQIKPEEIKNIVDKIPEYFIQMIYDNIENNIRPFNKINYNPPSPNLEMVGFSWEDKNYGLNIRAELSKIVVWIWPSDWDTDPELKSVQKLFDAMGDQAPLGFEIKVENGEKDYMKYVSVDNGPCEALEFIKEVIKKINKFNNKTLSL